MKAIHPPTILCAIVLVMLLCSEPAWTQKSFALDRKIVQLQKEVKTLTEKVKVLEARIVGLETLNAFPSSERLRIGMIQANKDAITNDINNLAANAYQYKIRPSTMGGGGGSYLNYKIPKQLARNDNGQYESVVTSDSTIVLTGTSNIKLGTVKAVVNKNGRLESFEYTGEFE